MINRALSSSVCADEWKVCGFLCRFRNCYSIFIVFESHVVDTIWQTCANSDFFFCGHSVQSDFYFVSYLLIPFPIDTTKSIELGAEFFFSESIFNKLTSERDTGWEWGEYRRTGRFVSTSVSPHGSSSRHISLGKTVRVHAPFEWHI